MVALPVRTIFMGSGAFGLPALVKLGASELVDLVAVVTAPPRPAGRKGELRATPAAEAAAELDVTTLTPARLRAPESLAGLVELAPGLIVLADYGKLVPAEVLDLPRHGALNLHPSLLPRHRGASPVPATILAGDAVAGVTLMRMDTGLDTGPIVAQSRLPLSGHELAPELEDRLAHAAADLLETSLPGWLEGRLEARPQPTDGATLTRPLRREDGRLDARRPAIELERQVRAYQPWPGSFLEVDGERLVVWAARVEDVEGDPGSPGSLLPHGDGLALVTGAGVLILDEVQPAGRRRMPGPDYRRGRRS